MTPAILPYLLRLLEKLIPEDEAEKIERLQTPQLVRQAILGDKEALKKLEQLEERAKVIEEFDKD